VIESADGSARARQVVASLIKSGLIEDTDARAAELRAVPIASPQGSAAGWFVGLVMGDRLIGFAQLEEDLRFRRFSSFRGHEPAATDWLDAGTVIDRAREWLEPEHDLCQPYLGYDVSPDRLAWVVTAVAPDGSERRLLVAGNEVFERPG
jgi:hypothetical protein